MCRRLVSASVTGCLSVCVCSAMDWRPVQAVPLPLAHT